MYILEEKELAGLKMNQHAFVDSTQKFAAAFSSNSIAHEDQQQYVCPNGYDPEKGLEENMTIPNSGDAMFDKQNEVSFKIPYVPPPKNASEEKPYFHQSQENLNASTLLGSQINLPSEETSTELVSKSNQDTILDGWYENKSTILANASYLTRPTKSEIFSEMVNEILQDYEKSKTEGDEQIVKLQELIQSNAERAIEEIATKWNEECANREEGIRQNLEEIKERMQRNEGLEIELNQFTAGMRDMYRLMQEQG